MLLRNYDNIMTAHRLTNFVKGETTNAKLATDTDVFGDGHINTKNTNGKIENYSMHGNNTFLPFYSFIEVDNASTSTNHYRSRIIVGSGNKPVSYDDYCLDTMFQSGETGFASNSSKVEKTYDEALGAWKNTYKRTFTNTSNEEITVREIGVIYDHYHNANYGTSSLVYRKVIDPITVEADANFVVSFTQIISANPNKPADYDASAAIVE